MTSILFIVPSLARAGAEAQVIDLINGLQSSEYNKHLLTFENNYALIDRLNNDDVTFYKLTRKNKNDLSIAKQVAELIDANHIKIVHCTLMSAFRIGWLSVLLAKQKPKLVAAIHTTKNRSIKDELLGQLFYRWLMRFCSLIIFVCEIQRNYWENKYKSIKKISETIYNGVDPDYYCPEKFTSVGEELLTTLSIPKGAFVVCHIAGFRQEKGHHILIDAFEEVLRQHDAYLIFAGDGLLKDKIYKEAQDRGLINNVRFIGWVTDVRPVLAASNISIIASTAVESFSIAMLESLAMGVPMVATDIGGTKEAVINEVTGLLIQPNNVEQLTIAMNKMVNEPEKRKRMGANARQMVISAFSKDSMVNKTASAFKKLVV